MEIGRGVLGIFLCGLKDGYSLKKIFLKGKRTWIFKNISMWTKMGILKKIFLKGLNGEHFFNISQRKKGLGFLRIFRKGKLVSGPKYGDF